MFLGFGDAGINQTVYMMHGLLSALNITFSSSSQIKVKVKGPPSLAAHWTNMGKPPLSLANNAQCFGPHHIQLPPFDSSDHMLR